MCCPRWSLRLLSLPKHCPSSAERMFGSWSLISILLWEPEEQRGPFQGDVYVILSKLMLLFSFFSSSSHQLTHCRAELTGLLVLSRFHSHHRQSLKEVSHCEEVEEEKEGGRNALTRRGRFVSLIGNMSHRSNTWKSERKNPSSPPLMLTR